MGYWLTIFTAFIGTFIPALGLHLLMSVGGVFFFGIIAMMQVAAYSFVLPQELGWGLGAAMALSLALTLLTALLFVLLHRRLSQDAFMIVSIASMMGMESVVSSWSSLTNGVQGISGPSRPELFSTLEALSYLGAAMSLVALVIAALFLYSKKGRFLRAQKEHPWALESLGVSAQSIVSQTIILASVFFAVGTWAILWKFRFLNPTLFSMDFLIMWFTVCVIATKAQVRWVVLGTAIVTFVPEIFRFLDLPTATFGYLRALLYAAFLVILVLVYKDRFSVSKRKI